MEKCVGGTIAVWAEMKVNIPRMQITADGAAITCHGLFELVDENVVIGNTGCVTTNTATWFPGF